MRGVDHLAVVGIALDLRDDAVHHRDRFDRVLARRRLGREHHSVRAVVDGRCDIRRFGASRRGRLDHRLQHLRGDDDGLARHAAGTHDALLDRWNLLGGISTPRSPRATMTASERRRSSSSRSIAAGFSSFARCRRDPRRSPAPRRCPPGAARTTARSSRCRGQAEIEIARDPCRSSRRAATRRPATLTPLRSESGPPDRRPVSPQSRPRSVSTRSRTRPSSSRSSLPGVSACENLRDAAAPRGAVAGRVGVEIEPERAPAVQIDATAAKGRRAAWAPADRQAPRPAARSPARSSG